MFALTDTIHLDAAMWSFIVSTVIPPIVGFLTTIKTSGLVKVVMNLVLNLINVAVATVITVGTEALISKQAVITAVFTYIVSHRAYADFWVKKGITSSAVPTEDPQQPGVVVMVPGKLSDVGLKAA